MKIKGFLCIAWGVSSTRYPIALTWRKTSGRGFGEIPAKTCAHYALEIYSFCNVLDLKK